jgi:hypothetical protein
LEDTITSSTEELEDFESDMAVGLVVVDSYCVHCNLSIIELSTPSASGQARQMAELPHCYPSSLLTNYSQKMKKNDKKERKRNKMKRRHISPTAATRHSWRSLRS